MDSRISLGVVQAVITTALGVHGFQMGTLQVSCFRQQPASNTAHLMKSLLRLQS